VRGERTTAEEEVECNEGEGEETKAEEGDAKGEGGCERGGIAFTGESAVADVLAGGNTATLAIIALVFHI
jgi:hypothetical protein